MMARVPSGSRRREASVQVALVVLALLALASPPAEGTIAILPAIPGDTAATYRWAFEAGALPIATGPYPGSIVVRGSRGALVIPAVAHGALLIGAPFIGCGAKTSEVRS